MMSHRLRIVLPAIALLVLGIPLSGFFLQGQTKTDNEVGDNWSTSVVSQREVLPRSSFDVSVHVDGHSREQYFAHGRRYIEATEGAEYEIRIRNPFGFRVAVALSVDGLNTIDARRTHAYSASKWVIGPYQTITIRGWQMSSARARRFYFTTEKDSYAGKLGKAGNVGLISAVFFRERQPVTILPGPRRGEPSGSDETNKSVPEAPSAGESRSAARARTYPPPDDRSAATGIGRNVRNDVRWIQMDLEARPISEVDIRYEYRDSLVRLGILPRRAPGVGVIQRRERATGFEGGGFSPEP